MAAIISELHLGAGRLDGFHGADPFNRLERLSRLNVFIGPNNSGKSRLLRGLFAATDLMYVPGDAVARKGIDALAELRLIARRMRASVDDGHTQAVEREVNKLRLPFFALARAGADRDAQDIGANDNILGVARTARNAHRDTLNLGNFADLYGTFRDARNTLIQGPTTNWEPVRIYFPALRGLRPLGGDTDLIRKRTIDDYFHVEFANNRGEPRLRDDTIVTGQTMNGEVRQLLLGTLQERQVVQDYEQLIGECFFSGKRVTLIPRDDADVLFVKIGNEKEQPIFALGDGIQQIIMLTLPLFLRHDADVLLFIEEPELYLHPGYQRLLIELFLRNPPGNSQIFVATHSQHFLDLTLDHDNISVYRVAKELDDTGAIEEVVPEFRVSLASDDRRDLLRELGVHNSAVLLANCTIWVEGITDRMYIRHFLALYARHHLGELDAYLEDIHYAFVEYSGGNITHWSFCEPDGDTMDAERICGDLMVVVDQDEDKEERHTKLTRYLGDRAYILPCREVENLLAPDTVRAVMVAYGEDAANLRNFGHTSYRDKPLGKYLDNQGFKDASKRKRESYAEASGTIKDKLKFAERAIDAMNDYEEMSEIACALTEAIVGFIKAMNPRRK